MKIESFEECIEELTRMVEDKTSEEDRARGALDIMDRLVAGVDSLDIRRFVPAATSYGRHLIYCDPQDRFCLLGLGWRPGQGTPIHDHPSWGVYGVAKGRIRFVNYVLEEEAQGNRLTPTGFTIAACGSSTTVIPPINDVHRLECPAGGETALTFHCYGQEPKEFYVYQRSGERRVGSLGYDSTPNE
ncbi:MAG: cysteine dioxygenase family protein [Planctomycetota bacterium]